MTQIAVKLPDPLVATIDRLVASGSFKNRSQAVKQALEALVDAEQRRAIDAAYAAGYANHPETEDEIAEATRSAIESIEDEPWERWW